MWIKTVADATSDLRLPSQPQGITAHDRYKNILLGDRGTRMLTTGLRLLTEIARQVIEPATAESQVQRPIHYSGRSHIEGVPITGRHLDSIVMFQKN